MSTENKKDAYYFKHDFNARNDIGLSACRTDAKEFAQGKGNSEIEQAFSLAAYAFYFIVVEILREQADFRLKMNAATEKYLAKETEMSVASMKKYLAVLTNEEYGVLKIEEGYLFSQRLINDMSEMNEVRSKYVQAGKRSGEARRKDGPAPKVAQDKPTPAPAPAKRSTVFSARFYSLWKDYCTALGGNTEERKTELTYIEGNFKDKEQHLINKLFAAITNETQKDFFKDLTKK